MISVKFYEAAEEEMIHAVGYYEAQQQKLGRRFLAAVQDSINRIVINPEAYSPVYPGIRRCIVKSFPFGIIFRQEKEKIIIVAVMHLHRDPDYWKERKVAF
jgi:toxin ParE1/3/4